MDLASEHCEACRPGAPKVTGSEQSVLLATIPEWNLVTIDGVPHLKRTFALKGWGKAVEFANKVAKLADAEGHHPAILIEWGKVTVEWWTHAIDGLHRNDFVMAAKVDAMLADT